MIFAGVCTFSCHISGDLTYLFSLEHRQQISFIFYGVSAPCYSVFLIFIHVKIKWLQPKCVPCGTLSEIRRYAHFVCINFAHPHSSKHSNDQERYNAIRLNCSSTMDLHRLLVAYFFISIKSFKRLLK